MTTRVLVSGSRNWRHPDAICDALDRAATRPDQLVVVHGNNGNADRGADRHAKARGWTVEAYDADWEGPCRKACKRQHRRPRRNGVGDYCPAAGVYRNQQMIDTRPGLCLVFVRDHSSGAGDALRRARAAGIETVAFYDCGCHQPDGTPHVAAQQLQPVNGGLF